MNNTKSTNQLIGILLLFIAFVSQTHAQNHISPNYLIQYTGTIPFNDTVKTYVHIINDSILIVEETIILNSDKFGSNDSTKTKEYAPWYYYCINKNTKRHKLFKVDFDGKLSYEGDNPMNENTNHIDFLYGGEEPAFTIENFLTKSTRTDSGEVTIVSTIPDRYPDFTTKYYFKKRDKNNYDIPSLSPKADSSLNTGKYCYMTETISNKEPNYYGRTEIFRNYSMNKKQNYALQKLIVTMTTLSD